VLSQKPLISDETELLDPYLLDNLLENLGKLSSVYYKADAYFSENQSDLKLKGFTTKEVQNSSFDETALETLQDFPLLVQSAKAGRFNFEDSSVKMGSCNPFHSSSSREFSDFFESNKSSSRIAKTTFLTPFEGKGLEIGGTFLRKEKKICFELSLMNHSLTPLKDLAIIFEPNSFGLHPVAPLDLPCSIEPTALLETSIILDVIGPVKLMEPVNDLQVIVTNNVGLFRFDCLIPAYVLFEESGNLEREEFLSRWKDSSYEEIIFTITVAHSEQEISEKLSENNIFIVAKRLIQGRHVWFTSIQLSSHTFLIEFGLLEQEMNIVIKTKTPQFFPIIKDSIVLILH
jgi:AP-1 complex subunit beta-1